MFPSWMRSAISGSHRVFFLIPIKTAHHDGNLAVGHRGSSVSCSASQAPPFPWGWTDFIAQLRCDVI